MKQLILGLVALLLAGACTAPRSILYSPEALPKGGFEVGLQADGNIPTQTSEALYGGMDKGVSKLYDRFTGHGDTAISADSLNQFARALIAYSVDPIGLQTGLFLRYGFWPRFDAGYHRSGGANVFDFRWQFLGSRAGDTIPEGSPWKGSIGLQYSSQSFELPSTLGLDKLQEILQYNFDRKDILVPLIVGKPFGKKGRFGGFGLGLAYNLSIIEYDSDVRKLVERTKDGSTKAFDALHGEKTISSYGGFANARVGYRWVYLVGSFSAYWQDYGMFKLFGGQQTELNGWTFVPSLALEFLW